MFPKRIKELQDQLSDLYPRSENNGVMNQISILEKDLDDMLECEELWWSQRAKPMWLKDGDKNTKYFMSEWKTAQSLIRYRIFRMFSLRILLRFLILPNLKFLIPFWMRFSIPGPRRHAFHIVSYILGCYWARGNYYGAPGRGTLTKAVDQAIPIYVMSCFLLPKATCDKMESLISRFWTFREFNMAFLANQSWRILRHPESLVAMCLKAKKIDSLFLPFEADYIKQIPLIGPDIPDQILWAEAKDGEYSVKLGYQTLRRRDSTNSNQASCSSSEDPLWNMNLVWRIFHNCLPTRSNLRQKGVLCTSQCPRREDIQNE
ncbi:hypothetical protein TSUD_34590 [Trifolium subterraneum]|uniref:Uncharacterized protein n=1 Tax=Trifolium subterraneum TaxID=3900 RepID=A0A2Z6P1M4_TRISU|nr:hypothetical protein TSUD_34590 [Trifolium subterraneum]